jgi:hypothetical protein
LVLKSAGADFIRRAEKDGQETLLSVHPVRPAALRIFVVNLSFCYAASVFMISAVPSALKQISVLHPL